MCAAIVRSDVVDRFTREGTLLLGGGYAILLQVADPVVGAAVAHHSDFANRPLHRLHNTLTFVYGVMLGTPAESAVVATATTAAHTRIPGANDPERQLWVAATLYETAVRVYERVHGPVGAPERHEVLARYARLGTALQMPATVWPADPSAFADYWAATVATLEIGPDARRVAHDLFHPTTAPLWLRAVLPVASLLTASLLDPPLRDAFGMRWSPPRARRARVAWAVIRAAARVLPQRVLTAPSRHYLSRIRVMPDRAA